MQDQKEPTQWVQFKELFEKKNNALQEDNTEFIKQLQIDFEKEILIINGKEVEEPVIVALPYKGEWKRRKVFRPEGHCKHGSLPEISITIKNPDKLKISEEHMETVMRLGNEGYPLSSLKEMKCEQEQYLTPEEEIEYLQDRYLKELKEQRNFERNVIISLVALAFQCLAMLIMVISLLLRI